MSQAGNGTVAVTATGGTLAVNGGSRSSATSAASRPAPPSLVADPPRPTTTRRAPVAAASGAPDGAPREPRVTLIGDSVSAAAAVLLYEAWRQRHAGVANRAAESR